MVIARLSLPIPSTRNHLFLLHAIFNKARKMLGIGGLRLTNPSTRNHFFLLHGALNRVRIMFPSPGKISYFKVPSTDPGSYWLLLPLPIPSTRNPLLSLYGVFNRARIMFGIAGLTVAIPSTIDHHFLPQSTLNRVRIMLGISCLPLTIPFTRNHSCLWHQDHVGYCWPLSYCFIIQESSLSLQQGHGSVGCSWPPSCYSIQQASLLFSP